MSYCRWSSDNWQCDLYCYGDVRGGFTTHVAGNHLLGEIPKLRVLGAGATDEDWNQWFEEHRRQMAWLKTAHREPIGLPHDSKTFSDPDLVSFLQRLRDLRALGYRFPDYVLEVVRSEIADALTSGRDE